MARHAEVEDHGVAAVGVDQPIFGAAAQRRDPRAGQPLAEIGRKRPPQILAARLDPGDALARRGRAPGRARWFRLREARAWRHAMAKRAPQSPLEAAPMTDKVQFGDQLVAPEEKTRRVGGVFSSVARRYDVMNDLMSGGMHRLWKDRFVARVKPRAGETILDMAGGTGDIAFRMAEARRAGHRRRHQPGHAQRRHGARRETRHRRPGLAEQNAEKLSFADKHLRRLHHRLRHPERDRHPRRAPRSASRAQARRALVRARILDQRMARLRRSSMTPIRSGSSRRSARRSPTTRTAIATWSNRSAASRAPRPSGG